MNDFLVPVVVAMVAIMSPLLLSSLNTRQQRLMKREDYARQDIVADRAEAAAQAVADRQDAIAIATSEAARLLLEKQNSIAAEVRNVATRAEETAGLLVSANAEVADKVAIVAANAGEVADKVALVAANAGEVALKVAIVAENANITNEKLEVIHTLVNSSMTAAIQSEFEATVRELAMMQEVVELRKSAGQGEPSSEMMAALKSTELKIKELKETLAERHRQDELAQAQVVKIVAAEGLKREESRERHMP